MPTEGEDPFYVLLHNDDLVTRLSVATDDLLNDDNLPNGYCKLLITVDVKPFLLVSSNMGFA